MGLNANSATHCLGSLQEPWTVTTLHSGLVWLQQNRSRPGGEELVEPVLERLLPSG